MVPAGVTELSNRDCAVVAARAVSLRIWSLRPVNKLSAMVNDMYPPMTVTAIPDSVTVMATVLVRRDPRHNRKGAPSPRRKARQAACIMSLSQPDPQIHRRDSQRHGLFEQ